MPSYQDEVFSGMQALVDSLREYNIGKSIQTARKKIDELSKQDINEFDRRAAQAAIAQSTAQAVLGLGGTAEAAQQIRLGMSPPDLDMREAQLRATGKDTVAEATIALQKEQEAAQIRAEKRKHAYDLELQQMKNEGIADKPTKAKDFSVGDKNMIAKSLELGKNFNDAIDRATRLSGAEFLSPEILSRDRRLFKLVKKNSVDVLTRFRTGAALSKAEEKFYDDLIEDMSKGDVTPERVIENIQTIKQGARRAWESRVEVGEDSGVDSEILNRYKLRGERIFGSPAPARTPAANPQAPARSGGWMNYFKPSR